MEDEPETTIDTDGLDGPYLPCHLSVDPVNEKFTVIGYGQVWDGHVSRRVGRAR